MSTIMEQAEQSQHFQLISKEVENPGGMNWKRFSPPSQWTHALWYSICFVLYVYTLTIYAKL